MRTTITLDADTRLLVERTMRERGRSFRDVVNDAIRAGLRPPAPSPCGYTTARALGSPRVDLTKALRLAGELEDEALARDLAEGR